MTVTTDPRTVATGPVDVSYTSVPKRDALLGRMAMHTLADGTVVVGRIESVTGSHPIMRITAGALAGRTCRLHRRITLV